MTCCTFLESARRVLQNYTNIETNGQVFGQVFSPTPTTIQQRFWM
jgi:hypothetical protein